MIPTFYSGRDCCRGRRHRRHRRVVGRGAPRGHLERRERGPRRPGGGSGRGRTRTNRLGVRVAIGRRPRFGRGPPLAAGAPPAPPCDEGRAARRDAWSRPPRAVVTARRRPYPRRLGDIGRGPAHLLRGAAAIHGADPARAGQLRDDKEVADGNSTRASTSSRPSSPRAAAPTSTRSRRCPTRRSTTTA